MVTRNLTDPTLGKGPNDLFRFGNADDIITASDPLFGGYNINAGGGDDTVTGSSGDDTLEGGTGNDSVSGGDGSDIIFGGKANGTEGHNRETTQNRLFGELEFDTITTNGTGDGDTIFGGDGAGGVGFSGGGNEIFGDYGSLIVSAGVTYTGGGDTIFGGDAVRGIPADNDLVGDVGTLTLLEDADYTGGNDNITGGTDSANSIWGDVFQVTFGMGSQFTGGNDVITGGSGSLASNFMVGDAQIVSFNISDDGDAVAEVFTGGNDTLISGTNVNDTMYGDVVLIKNDDVDSTFIGGADTFVFGSDNGSDTIKDFEAGKDKINLTATGVTETILDDSDPLDNVINGSDAFVTVTGTVADGNAIMVIDLGAAVGGAVDTNIVTIEGVEELATSDFMFA